MSDHQTIFPRVNFLKERNKRFDQRAANGRIYGDDYFKLDDTNAYPPASGSSSFSDALPFPVDLGPDVSTATTSIFDLREDDGLPTVYDLN